jgi:hypothetical protein
MPIAPGQQLLQGQQLIAAVFALQLAAGEQRARVG